MIENFCPLDKSKLQKTVKYHILDKISITNINGILFVDHCNSICWEKTLCEKIVGSLNLKIYFDT